MSLFKKLMSIFALLVLFAGAANAASGDKNLFITLTTDNVRESGMGLAIANAMQGAGVNTTVLVGADAVNLVLKNGKQDPFGPTGKTAREMLISLSKAGGDVMLCGMCAKYSEVKSKDLVYGARIVGPSDVAGALLAPQTQTLSY